MSPLPLPVHHQLPAQSHTHTHTLIHTNTHTYTHTHTPVSTYSTRTSSEPICLIANLFFLLLLRTPPPLSAIHLQQTSPIPPPLHPPLSLSTTPIQQTSALHPILPQTSFQSPFQHIPHAPSHAHTYPSHYASSKPSVTYLPLSFLYSHLE